MFIVFEGIDGSGKSGHAKLFVRTLKKLGKKVKVYSYPDRKGPYGKILASFLDKKLQLDPTTQFLTFLADMVKDQERLRKDMNEGYWVVTDRYVFSTIAYQTLPLQKAIDIVEAMHLIKPDAVIRMNVTPDIALGRILPKRRYHMYEKDPEHSLRAHLKYNDLEERKFMTKWISIDSSKPKEKVAEDIKSQLLKK